LGWKFDQKQLFGAALKETLKDSVCNSNKTLKWRDFHKITQRNILLEGEPFDSLGFANGPHPIPGGRSTLRQTANLDGKKGFFDFFFFDFFNLKFSKTRYVWSIIQSSLLFQK
jgi:hypothetical protein